jgi:predicted enzyme related to lactoylglutathione lyase
MIKLKVSSIFVTDQQKAMDFYTQKVGFVVKTDVPAGEYKWLTVGTEDSEFELLLEPNAHPASKEYQDKIFADGIPATMFFVDDIKKEYDRLKGLGVEFKTEPVDAGGVMIAVFNDTCGNYITLCQQ